MATRASASDATRAAKTSPIGQRLAAAGGIGALHAVVGGAVHQHAQPPGAVELHALGAEEVAFDVQHAAAIAVGI